MSEFFDNAGVSAYPYFEGEKTNPDTINEGKVQWLIDKVMNEKDGTLTDDIKAVLKGFNPAEQELFNCNYRAINELTDEMVQALYDEMATLEASYADETSMNYNPDILRFLSLYQNTDPNAIQVPGSVLHSLVTELKTR